MLTTTAAIRDLTPQIADQGIPVRLEAMVTYYDRVGTNLFVNDGTGGIFVEFSGRKDLKLGSRVIVTGVTAGDFTNYVIRPVIRSADPQGVTGLQFQAKPVTMRSLVSGDADCEFVRATGVVRSASVASIIGRSALELRLEEHGLSVDVRILDFAGLDIDSLLDAEIGVTGAAAGYFNDRKELVGAFLSTQGADQISILRNPRISPYLLPVQPMGQILRHRVGLQLGRRTHVEGTVTYVNSGNSLMIQSGPDALLIRTRQKGLVAVGNRIDAVGFAAFGEYSPMLEDANFRVLGPGANVQAIKIQGQTELAGTTDSKLITIDAHLLSSARDSKKYTLALSHGKVLFSALLEGPIVPALQGIEPGSDLRVTGISSVETEGSWKLLRGYRLLLRTPGDIEVVTAPRWWNTRRLLFVLGGMAAVVFLSMGWVILLRRRVDKQTNEIRRVLKEDADRDKELARMQEARSRVLERINSREPLASVLQSVARLVDQQSPDLSCRIHLANEEGNHEIRSTEDANGPQPAHSLPIALPGGEVAGSIRVFRNAGALAPSLVERLTLAAQLAALAIDSRRLHDRLTHRSQHDILTGLPNRALLDEKLTESMDSALASGERIAIAYVDLDKIKQVNDVYGHKVGDQYLQSVAARFRNALRCCDTLARVGGDEFIALLTGVRDHAHAEEIAQRLMESLSQPLRAGEGRELPCSASIGIAVFPDDGLTLDELKHHADASMYEAKRASKPAGLHAVGVAGGQLISPDELRDAISDERLLVYYQPIFSKDGKLTGFEALVRLRRANGELVPPDRFIETAESSGLIVPLGDFVLREACRQTLEWELRTRAGLCISVNVSASQLARPHFAENILESVAQTGMPPRLLHLELTESIAVQNVASASEHLRTLRHEGVRIALDDFGTGFSNLSALQRLPMDIVKIDRSLVTALGRTPSSLPLVQAIFAMAKSLGVETVAEGIESAGHADTLDRLGCAAFQGYGFSKPMPAAAIDARLDRWLTPVADVRARLEQTAEIERMEKEGKPVLVLAS